MNIISNRHSFNPDGPGLRNGNFIGLPFTAETANIILLPVPWDVTVSYREGTAYAPQAILDASIQIDLEDYDVHDAWKLGIFWNNYDGSVLKIREELRGKASSYILFLEKGGDVKKDFLKKYIIDEINAQCDKLNSYVYCQSKKILEKSKFVGIVGGDHSVNFGLIKALLERYSSFGILHIDAHLDLRKCYEGFYFSHASVFYNILKEKGINRLVQVAIRDYCEEELEKVKKEHDRVIVFFDQQLKENYFKGVSRKDQSDEIVGKLPENVYISIDIDGLDPKLCPHTGTPVPGGLDFYEMVFLLKKVVESGRKIIGFDLCETGNDEWDANVGARVLYKLCNLTGKSQGLI
jgi:agmatinase